MYETFGYTEYLIPVCLSGMQFVSSYHNLQRPVSIVFIDIRIVNDVNAPAVLRFLHKFVSLREYHGFHGAALLGHHGHADCVVVAADGPQAADAEVLLGELGLFIALAEGLQAFQLVHQRF